MTVDVRWHVPEGYDVSDREVVLPPPRGSLGHQPTLGILSVRALEEQAAGEGVLALVAWQIIAGASDLATRTLERVANVMDMSGLELLVLGHAYVATGLGAGAGFETAQRARKLLKQPVTASSIDASLLLGVTALPFGAERVRTLLGMLEPELQQATDEHRAVHALLTAAVAPEPAHLDQAYDRFAALGDDFGLAQCALLAHAREAAGDNRVDVKRAYLEHAIYRYEADGRPEWAARTIVQGVVPLLTEDPSEQLARAAAFATQARSHLSVDLVFRSAAKLGYAATATTLSQLEPPTFAKRAPSAGPAAEPKPKKPAAKRTKKRS